MSQLSQQADFARRLRALRAAKGMTQRELAGDALSVSYVSLLEAGRRTPTAQTVRTLAAALGCSTDELVGEAESVATQPPPLQVRYGQLALEAGRLEQAQELFEAVRSAPDLDPLTLTDAEIGAARVLEAQGRLREDRKSVV